MRAYFERLAAGVCTLPAGLDRSSLHFSAEDSDFLRFNKAKVRQATHVQQRYGTVSVVAGSRRASSTCALSGDAEADLALLLAERGQLARQLPLVPEDPFLLLPDTVHSTERAASGSLPKPAQLVADVTRLAAGTDLVGFYAAGPMVRGYADSRGQRNWHAVDSFHFEWCLYREADLAVKSSYAGAAFSPRELVARMESARGQLEVLGRPRKTLAPGAYRVCFSPVAVADLLATLSWGGFGERAARTGVSTLVQLQRGLQQFHPSVRLTEDIASGLAPAFQDDGFVKPAQVPLVADGRMAGTLASPRSARGGADGPGGAGAG
jgi:predicted Zn-dependent protease